MNLRDKIYIKIRDNLYHLTKKREVLTGIDVEIDGRIASDIREKTLECLHKIKHAVDENREVYDD